MGSFQVRRARFAPPRIVANVQLFIPASRSLGDGTWIPILLRHSDMHTSTGLPERTERRAINRAETPARNDRDGVGPVGLATPTERIRMTPSARASLTGRQAAGFPSICRISSSTGASDAAIARDRHDSDASKPGALLRKRVRIPWILPERHKNVIKRLWWPDITMTNARQRRSAQPWPRHHPRPVRHDAKPTAPLSVLPTRTGSPPAPASQCGHRPPLA